MTTITRHAPRKQGLTDQTACNLCGTTAHYVRDEIWYCDDHAPLRGQALIDSLTRTLATP